MIALFARRFRQPFLLIALLCAVLGAQQGGAPTGAYLGAQLEDLKPEQRTQYGLKEGEGVFVANVVPDGPAAKAGVKTGDVILKIGGKDIANRDALIAELAKRRAGEKVKLLLLSDGKHEEPEITLAARPASTKNQYSAVQALHGEYVKREKQVGAKDLKSRLELAHWCEEQGISFDARLEYDKVLKIDANHAETRKALGWRKGKSGEWERDSSLFAKTIQYVADQSLEDQFKDDKGYKVMRDYIKDPKTWESMLDRLHERTGLYRLPSELDITVRFSTAMPPQAAGVTKSIGFVGAKNSFRVTIDLHSDKMRAACRNGSTKMLDVVTIHELFHALTTPSMTRWPRWLAEGMAAYAAHEEEKVRSIEKEIPDLDQPIKNYYQNYGRGFVFMRYIEFTGGMEKVNDFINRVVVLNENVKSAAQAVMGKKWEELKPEELKFAKDYVADHMKRYGTPPPGAPILGVMLGWEGDEGVEVMGVTPGLGADKGGIKEGDYLMRVDKQEVKTMMDLRDYIWKKKPGEAVKVKIRRDDKELEMSVVLSESPSAKRVPSPPQKK